MAQNVQDQRAAIGRVFDQQDAEKRGHDLIPSSHILRCGLRDSSFA
jgi:hypothetical protein